LKAELNTIRVGPYSSIGEGTSIITSNAVPQNVPASTTIGSNVYIGNNCTIYSSIIDNEAYIGSNTVILEGSKIEKGAVIVPNSFIPPGRLIPGGQLWGGNPVQYIRDVTEQERVSNLDGTMKRWDQAKKHMDSLNGDVDNLLSQEKSEELNTYLKNNYFDWRAKYY
jgi:carbonic anhydrase/acetyltransferase-like protein (isoleucine patch superfamily)